MEVFFAVFSATERERLHGHTHAVKVSITGPVANDGMIANYAVFKKRVRDLCDAWDEYYLIPSRSPFVSVREEGGRCFRMSAVHLHCKSMPTPNLLPTDFSASRALIRGLRAGST
jgi:6-pyruvoyl-tetrahydropterin synthase